MKAAEQPSDEQAVRELASRVRAVVGALGGTMGAITEAEMAAMVTIACVRARSFGLGREGWIEVCEAAWQDVDTIWGKAESLVAMRREAHEP